MSEVQSEDRDYLFDVAVSFAGEDREYAEDVVKQLKAAGVRVFLDSDYEADMWGADLVEYFDDVYRVKSHYAMLFTSRWYADKMWTRHERRSALARALEQSAPYVLPVRLDDTSLDGLRPTVGYLDARRVGIEGIVAAVLAKVRGEAHLQSTGAIAGVPRTEADRQRVLLDRPRGWEYLYFAGELLHARDSLDDKYRDHELQWAARTGFAVTEDDVPGYLTQEMNEALRLCGSLNQVMNPAAQERAFGLPGQPGDVERMRHLAHRWNGIYEGFMDWAARVRGVTAPSKYAAAIDALACYADGPVESYRTFVDDLVTETDKIPAALAADEPVEIRLSYVLEIPDEVSQAFSAELRRLRADG